MDHFDLLFEGLISGRQALLAINVFAINPQGLSTDRFVAGATNYFDFFCKCIFSVNSPIKRFSSSFSRLSLLYCSIETTDSPVP